MASWMVYAALIAGLSGLAALSLERALRLNRRQARGAWAVAMAASVVAPVVMAWWPPRAAPLGGTGTSAQGVQAGAFDIVKELGILVSTPPAALDRLNGPLTVFWIVASLVGVAVVIGGFQKLRSLRAHCRPASVDETEVLVSDDFGPALIGLAKADIVLPRWVLELPPAERGLVLAHEAEHRSAKDTHLLASGVFAVLLMPWNLPLLWQLRRLRRAVEMDCDGRVLRRGASPVEYGELLLRMGARIGAPVPFAATLTQPRSLLERRIEMMTRPMSDGRVRRTLIALGVAAVATAVACETPAPTQIQQDSAVAMENDASGAGETAEGIVKGRIPDGDQPLIIVDGVITDRRLSGIDAVDVESIEVIKGAAAEKLYGDRARNGVISITTKSAASEPVAATFEATGTTGTFKVHERQ